MIILLGFAFVFVRIVTAFAKEGDHESVACRFWNWIT
jgi:hypothetical protein